MLKKIALAALIVLVAVQFIPVDRRNPQIDPSQTIEAREKLPPQVESVFRGTCANCHSNQTQWPWYSYIAPVSWMIASDVHQGRNKMNFSEWGRFSPEKREDRLEEICEQLTNGEMPDRKYVFLHRAARPTPQQRDAICRWADDSRQY